MSSKEKDLTRQIKDLESNLERLKDKQRSLCKRVSKIEKEGGRSEHPGRYEMLKEERDRVTSEKNLTKRRLQEKKWQRHKLREDATPQSEEEWKKRFREVAEEASDLRQENKKLRKSRRVMRRKVQDAKELLKAVSAIRHVAKTTRGDENRSIYSSASANLWLDDLWEVEEVASECDF